MTTNPDPPLIPWLELIKARLREMVREKGVLFWVFAFPLLMALGLGLAFRSQPTDPVRVAVVGSQTSVGARALLENPQVEAVTARDQEAERDLARGKVDIVVKLDQGPPVYRYDMTREKGYPARIQVDGILQRAFGRRDVVEPIDQPVSKPGTRYIDFLLPGLIGLNLMGTSMWGVGYNLVVARKRRLLRRYAVTPMRRSHFLLSYFVARSLFLVLEMGVLVVFGKMIFGAALHGSILGFGVIGVFGAASFAGISLVIGARVENTESANGWMNVVQLPMWVMSGTFFSYERFPDWLLPVIRGLPLTALNDALRGVFNDAMPLGALLPQLLVLASWGIVGFLVALRSFRWQ